MAWRQGAFTLFDLIGSTNSVLIRRRLHQGAGPAVSRKGKSRRRAPPTTLPKHRIPKKVSSQRQPLFNHTESFVPNSSEKPRRKFRSDILREKAEYFAQRGDVDRHVLNDASYETEKGDKLFSGSPRRRQVSIPDDAVVEVFKKFRKKPKKRPASKQKGERPTPPSAPKTARRPGDKIKFAPNAIELRIFTQPGLESILYQELERLSIPFQREPSAAKVLQGSIDVLHQCQLSLGSARQMQLQIGEPFSTRALGELRRKVSNLPWSDIITAVPAVQSGIRVQTSIKSRLLHTAAIENCIRQGIEDCLGTEVDAANDAALGPTIHAVIRNDHLHLSIDTLSIPMHQRQYRLETGKAPLREDLAFALVQASGWATATTTTTPPPLLDPFCGAGTIAIEAASMAMHLPPGRFLPAPLQGTTLYNPTAWQELVQTAAAATVTPPQHPIVFASDRDRGVIQAARRNAERAGVSECIDFQEGAFSGHPLWTTDSSLYVVSNPPFGKRARKHPSTERNFYQKLAHQIDAQQHCQALFLTSDPMPWQRAGFQHPMETVLRTWHGGIAVDGLLYRNFSVGEGDHETVRVVEAESMC